ncbi:MAG TPA: hypothetical protein V6C72_10300 [Chroococcales cyanobacterium]
MHPRQAEVLRITREEREGSAPTIHPNGFIQLKLTNDRRMHFWHPEIPRQKVGSPIHDHIFDMASVILLGTLFHREVHIQPDRDGYYVIWEAVPVRDTETELVSTGERVRADHGPEQELKPGDHYFFEAFCFHLTRDAVPAVSIIRKRQEFEGRRPRVLVPAGQKPDNDFTRDSFDPEFIEQFIFRVIEEAR